MADVAKNKAKIISDHLEELMEKYGFVRPERGVDDYPIGTAWRSGKPDYGKADLAFFEGRSKSHPAGSLPFIVENLVKKWEMEVTHLGPDEWTTVDKSDYRLRFNGRESSGVDAALKGTYNWLLENAPKDLYDSSKHTLESSHQVFRGAFPDGFGWEVLEVFSGPPKVAFTWRHWGRFAGSYQGRKGDGEVIELYGFNVAIVNESLQIRSVDVYFKPEGFLEALMGIVDPEVLKNGNSLLGSCCPIHKMLNP